jgi:uncharacterized protein
LRDSAPAAVAVSGGVDSMTLAFVAQRVLGKDVCMFHAVSPAVPPHATARVERYAADRCWQLSIVSAGEFADERYVANPANRCFFCKQNLYGTIAGITDHQLLSGTNLDDLGDWRPGLKAAADHSVRHPFVEAEIDKADVRAIARYLGLDDIAELPGAPCLSSRVETGIPIAPRELRFVDAAERFVRRSIAPQTVRCRIRKSGIVIELDAETRARIDRGSEASLAADLGRLAGQHGIVGTIAFALYERGSAFLREGS